MYVCVYSGMFVCRLSMCVCNYACMRGSTLYYIALVPTAPFDFNDYNSTINLGSATVCTLTVPRLDKGRGRR